MNIDEIKNRKILPATTALAYGYSALRGNMVSVMYLLIIIYFPISLLSSFVAISVGSIESSLDLTAMLSSPELIESFISSPEYIRLATLSFADSLIEMALYPFGAMAVIYITKAALEEKNPNFKEVLSASFSNAGTFLVSMLVFSICVGVLSLFIVIPGVFLAVIWTFYLEAIVIDGCTGIKSLGHSRSLVKGRWWKTFLYLIVFFCFNYVLSYAVGIIFSLFGGSYFAVVISGMVLSFISMIFAAGKTVVYLNYCGNQTSN